MSQSVQESVVRLGGSGVSSCGYCGGEGFTSHGCMTEKLTVEDYQDMIDRGWRRSGKYIYKPTMDQTCCPQYTIRLRAEDFKANKEQEKVVRKMEKYLNGQNNNQIHQMDVVENGEVMSSDAAMLQKLIQSATKQLIDQNILSQECRVEELKLVELKKGKGNGKIRNGIFTCPVGFKLHRFLFQIDGQEVPKKIEDKTRIIADALLEIIQPQLQNGWIVNSLNGHLNFDNQEIQQHLNNQISNSSKQPKATSQEEQQQSQTHKLEVIEVASEYIEEEYQLYKRYQMNQHGDNEYDVSPYQYRRFLVDSPLIRVSQKEDINAPKCGYGSFHHQYRIDGRLVAVGVVDVLPRCLSSVYLFWDPEYAHLSLGKYSAVNEINWVKEVCQTCPQLQYYYMGYYIQSCHKMRYKGDYQPSQLLCPLKFTWIHITDEITKILTEQKYCVLSQLQKSAEDDNQIENGNQQGSSSEFCLVQRALTESVPKQIIENTQIIIKRLGRMSCGELLQMNILISPKEFFEAIQEWHVLAGPAAERIVLYV